MIPLTELSVISISRESVEIQRSNSNLILAAKIWSSDITSANDYISLSILFVNFKPFTFKPKRTCLCHKWLWNRLMTGPIYNLSLAVLSQDSYYCPSMVTSIFLISR